jgi:hypothetical protein
MISGKDRKAGMEFGATDTPSTSNGDRSGYVHSCVFDWLTLFL